mmetsp:Transcript_10771/g.44815  ORF Transcript_10771/g.44815 Transcript_10771/m.44815 type:complete len:216 (+) Transcript_10771:820-1467(+)
MGRVVRHVHLPRAGRVGGWKRKRRKRGGGGRPPLDAGCVRDGVVLHPTGVDSVRGGAGVRAAVPDAEPEGARGGVVRVRRVRRELRRRSALQVCGARREGVWRHSRRRGSRRHGRGRRVWEDRGADAPTAARPRAHERARGHIRHRGDDHGVRVPFHGPPAVRGDGPSEVAGAVREVGGATVASPVHVRLRRRRDGRLRALRGRDPRRRARGLST